MRIELKTEDRGEAEMHHRDRKSGTGTLFGLEHLLPRGLSHDLVEPWLRAPIGGVPLYLRICERLAGARLKRLRVPLGEVGARFVSLARTGPGFGVEFELVSPLGTGAPKESRDSVLLFVPGLPQRPIAPAVKETHHPSGAAPVPIPVLSTPSVLALNRGEDLIQIALGALGGTVPDLALRGTWRRGVLHGAGTRVHRTVEVRGQCAVGRESVVESKTLLQDCVLGEGCYVGKGCRLMGVVLLDGTEVLPGTELRDQVRGTSGPIDNTRLEMETKRHRGSNDRRTAVKEISSSKTEERS